MRSLGDFRVGDKLRHQSGGSLWEVLEHVGGPANSFQCKCIEEGPGSKLDRVAVFHHEYMVRSFLVEAGFGQDRRRVVVKTIDLDTDEVLAQKKMGPESDYVIVTGPGYHVAHEQHFSPSGTTQLTIKRRPSAEKGGRQVSAAPLHRDEVDGCVVLYQQEGDCWRVARDQDECDHFRSTETQSPGRHRYGITGLSGTTRFVRVRRIEEAPIGSPLPSEKETTGGC